MGDERGTHSSCYTRSRVAGPNPDAMLCWMGEKKGKRVEREGRRGVRMSIYDMDMRLRLSSISISMRVWPSPFLVHSLYICRVRLPRA